MYNNLSKARNSKILKMRLFLFSLIFGCGISYATNASAEPPPEIEKVQQPGITVTGKVSDEKGESLPGASVVIKGMTMGVVSDINGKFTITVPTREAVLVISFVGYATQEIVVGNRNVFDVILMENPTEIEEVVVTAFATQRKVNVTGAISVVGGDDIMAAPVSNISNALVGLVPGISALQTGGEPGRNAAEITIRGVATYAGNTQPLIVIDGIEQAAEQAFTAFNNLDANDILGISVLKDASSTAVYGIRAANGVIIVTTKRGQAGKPKVSISSSLGFTKATSLQKGLTSLEWAMFRNEGIQNEMNAFGTNLTSFIYDDLDLWKFQNNRDFHPNDIDKYYPNLTPEQREQALNSPARYYTSSDLYVERFSRLAPQWQNNVNISGGTDRVKYYVSLGHFSQQGITNNDKYQGVSIGSGFTRYNFRANVDVEVAKWTTVSVNLSGQFGTTHGPGRQEDPYNNTSRYQDLLQIIYDGNPLLNPGIVDGHLVYSLNYPAESVQQELRVKTANTMSSQNPVFNLLTAGTGYLYNTLLDNTIRMKHQMPYLVKGLSLQASVNYQDNYTRYVTISPALPTYEMRRGIEDPNTLEFFGGGIGGDSFSSSGLTNWNKLYIDAGIYYDGIFRKHQVGMLFLGKASRYTMPGTVQNPDPNNTPSGILGFVGRVTYAYDQRYMAEFNMGYNGTEQFDKGKRFGFFPAYSAGWVLTNESFFPANIWLTFFKIRGSYGVVGNDQLGTGSDARRYLYLPSTYNLNSGGYYFGSSNGSVANPYYNGVSEGSLGNPNVTWEKSTKWDIGIEARFINNKLLLELSRFNEDRNNILTRLGVIPANYGVSLGNIPPANVGKTNNYGYDVLLSWNDRAGRDFRYSIEGHLSYARNKVIFRAEAPNPYEWMNETGHMIGQKFGLKSDGFYNTAEELNARPYNTYNNNQQTLGDIKYLDLNSDGVIDQYDSAPIGYPNLPLMQYGFKLGFNYKGFDLRMLFNGTAQGSFQMRRIQIPFYKVGGNAFQWQYDGRWTEEKYLAGEKITYPRATFNSDITSHNFIQSDFWTIPNDFFKLKNAEIGYTFPVASRLIKNTAISSLRVYANGNNLYTFYSKLKKIGIDPETRELSATSYTWVYPITTTVIFGVNIQF